MTWPNSVRKSDLIIQFYRGSGPGGQHRNKVETACRIIHKPTNLSACSTKFKSQLQNKKSAFIKLADKLVPLMKKAISADITTVPSKDEIRVYNQHRNTVKDKRVPDKKWTYDDVLNKKGFDKIIEELNK